jgi:sulfotransferase family protein
MQNFFIVGRAHSGTTTLARMLALHPQLALAPDNLLIASLQRKYRHARWTAGTIDAFVSDVLRDERMRAWGLDAKRLSQRLNERLPALTFGEACRVVYASYARDVLGRVPRAIGDASTRNTLFLSRIERTLPDARYIHITRDYRASIRGSFRAAFDWGNAAVQAQRWKEYNEAILELSRRAPERCMWLRYEDLVAYPEHELSRVCRFLKVELDPRMLSLARNGAPASIPAPASVRPRGSAPSSAPLVPPEPWQRELPEPVIRQADAICGRFAERFGYHPEPETEPLPLIARLGVLAGSSSVLAEKIVFGMLPAGLSSGLVNACAALSARFGRVSKPMIRGGSVETAPAFRGAAGGITPPKRA